MDATDPYGRFKKLDCPRSHMEAAKWSGNLV